MRSVACVPTIDPHNLAKPPELVCSAGGNYRECSLGHQEPTMDGTEIRIANRRENMADVIKTMKKFSARHGLPAAVVNDFGVAVDEVLANIVSHGYPDGSTGEILVRFVYRPGEVYAEIEDDGVSFDPLRAPQPDLGATLQERKVGGLGIHFVRNLMDEVVYRRIEGHNMLRLKKRVPVI
jgi:serine/threonine-protein kinase RsbW